MRTAPTESGTTPRHGSVLLEVDDLSVAAMTATSERSIIGGVTLRVGLGEAVGIVGESGSGKSITARSLISLLPPGLVASGEVRFKDRSILELPEPDVRRLRGTEIALLPQDPFTMLNPLHRCGGQITEALRYGNGRTRESDLRVEAVRRLSEVGIRDPSVADRYPFQLSGGMRQRVGIAAALARDPELLIADEPSTALDVTTQKQILDLLQQLQLSRQMAVILITHDLRVAFLACQRIYVLYAGENLEIAGTKELAQEPLHPYSLGLLLAEPRPDQRLAKLAAIPGTVPPPDEVSGICAFAPRCRWRTGKCVSTKPPLALVEAGRWSRCIRVNEIRNEMNAELKATKAAIDEATLEQSPGTAEDLVAVSGLRKVFPGAGRGTAEVIAVDDVSLLVRPGESVGLVGESGSGKTTLSRCVLGLEVIDDGDVTIAGIRIPPKTRLDRHTRRAVSKVGQMVFQDPYTSLNPAMTVGGTLREAIAAGSDEPSEARVRELLELVGLPEAYARRRPEALSGGERQRVAIARALSVRPLLVVCDEPVSAIDLSVQAQVLNLLARLQEELGLGYLFTTHDLAVVRQVTSRVYVMLEGRVVEQGPTATVLDHPSHEYTRKLINAIPPAVVET
jgi:peptide/nickel transport system ATP-binding protein